MKAYDFIYDGKKLSEFGMVLCNFGGSKGVETVSDGCNITFNTISTQNGSKNELTSVQYEECLETTFQICKHSCNGGVQPITAAEHRELTKWLNRKSFLKLKILDDDYYDLYFEASFNVSRIEIDGVLYGLELEAKTNRPFALKEIKTFTMACSDGQEVYGWEKRDGDLKLGYVTSKNVNAYPSGLHTDGYSYTSVGQVFRKSINDESYEEGYIYPYMEIIINKDGDLKIHNSIENRETYIANCKAGEIITMDYPIIKSSEESHKIQNDFNWNFFRVANTYSKSRNDLTVFLPCTIKIKYSPIVKVGL